MELKADTIFLSSGSNDLFVYLFTVIGMGCEIKYIGTTESTNIPYVSVQLMCYCNNKLPPKGVLIK